MAKAKKTQKSKEPDPIKEKKEWLLDYIKSPKYKELLTREFEHSGKDVKAIDKEIKKRYNNVLKTKVVEKSLAPGGYNFQRGLFEENSKNVYIDPKVKDVDPALIVHELTHASTDADKQITPFAKRVIKSGNSKESYYTDPSEVHSRLTEFKYLLNKHGYYDPKKDQLNEDILEKGLKDSKIGRKLDIRDLKENFSNPDLLLMMNNIAQESDNKNVPIAKFGGDPNPTAKRLNSKNYLQNIDGTRSTHLMGSGDNYAWPNLLPKNPLNDWTVGHNPNDWIKSEGWEGFDKAKERGEVYKFASEKAAKAWANNEYKNVPMKKNGGKTNKKPDPKPIITNDPNDPRIKMYSDSLNLYNASKSLFKEYKKLENHYDSLDAIDKGYGTTDEADRLLKIIRASKKSLTDANGKKPKDTYNPYVISADNYYKPGEKIEVLVKQYKKPVQPVEYRPEEKKPVPKKEVPMYSKMEKGKRVAIGEDEYKQLLDSGNVSTNRTGKFLDKENTILKKMTPGGKINFDDLNLDETMSGINLIAGLTGAAINSIGNEYDIAALNKQVNPYFAEKGGNVSGAKEFNAPSHDEGGLGITANGSQSGNPEVEIEKDEVLYKFRHLPLGDYVFSTANGTSEMAKKILDKYRVKSKNSKTPDVITDPILRSKMEIELKDVVDINEKMNEVMQAQAQLEQQMQQQESQQQEQMEQPQMRYGGRIKKMPHGGGIDPEAENFIGQVDPLDFESTETINLNVKDEWGKTRTSPEFRTLTPEDMRANTEITYDPSTGGDKSSSKTNNMFSSSKFTGQGALARNSTLFLDALDSFKKPLKEAPIVPDYSAADAAMRSMSADTTAAEQQAMGAYNAATMENRNASNSIQQLMARQQGLSSGLSESLMQLASTKRGMLNEIAGQKVAYESGKAGTIAQAKYQNRIDNLMNEAARQQFIERARDNMMQMGMHLDKMEITKLQNEEGTKLLASYGNYFRTIFDEKGNPIETRIKTGG